MTTRAETLGQRVVALFTAPRTLFERLRERPVWFDVLVISTLVAVVAAAATPADVLLSQVEGAVSRRGEPVEITSPPGEIVRFNRYLTMMAAVVGHPMLVLGVAGLLTLVFGVLGGGRGSFRQHLAVTAHAFLLSSLALLVSLGLGLALGRPGGVFAAADEAGLTGYLLVGLNPFRLWMLALLGLGASIVNGRWRWPAATAVVLAAYLLLLITTATLTPQTA